MRTMAHKADKREPDALHKLEDQAGAFADLAAFFASKRKPGEVREISHGVLRPRVGAPGSRSEAKRSRKATLRARRSQRLTRRHGRTTKTAR